MPAHPRISFNDSRAYTQALEEFIRADSSKVCGRGHISGRKKCHKGGGSLKNSEIGDDPFKNVKVNPRTGEILSGHEDLERMLEGIEDPKTANIRKEYEKRAAKSEEALILGEVEARRRKQPGYSDLGYIEDDGENPSNMGVDPWADYGNSQDFFSAIDDRKKAMRKNKPPGYFNKTWEPEQEYEASKMLGFKKSEIQKIKKASETKGKKKASKGNLGVALGGALALGVAAPLPFILKSALDKDRKKREEKGLA